VPPGTVNVFRLAETGPKAGDYHRETVRVEPGNTATVALGRPAPWLLDASVFNPPDRILTGGRGALSTDGAFYHSFNVLMNANDMLTFDSIPAGEYTLSVSAYEWTEGRTVRPGGAEVTVPAAASPGTEIQLDDILLKSLPNR